MAGEQPAPQPGAQPQPQQTQQPPQTPPQDGQRPPSRTYTQADMDRITKKVRENAARDAELRLRREMESRPASTPAAQPDKKDPPQQDEAPKRETYSSYEEYVEARADWRARVAAREEREQAAKEEQERKERETLQTREKDWHGRINKAAEKYTDFATVMEDSEATLALIHSSPMRAFIVESDIGPEIIYELCRNPAEAKRIAELPPRKQAAEITKIEEKLAAAAPKPNDEEKVDEVDDPGKEDRTRDNSGRFTSTQKKEAPKPPPEPIEPGTSRSATASSKPSDKDDADTWRRKRVAEIEARRKGK